MSNFNKKVRTSLDDLHDEEHIEEQYIDIDAKDLDMAKKVFEEEMELELTEAERARTRRVRLRTGIDPNKGSKWDKFKVD